MLFNRKPYNTGLYDGSIGLAPSYLTDLVVFNSFSLADNSNTFCTYLEDSEPSRDILGDVVPRGDGMYTVADYWRQKVITVRGSITQADATTMETFLDRMRTALRKREQNLDITRNGVAKRYVATLTNPDKLFAERQGFHVTRVLFNAEFTCRVPFGVDRSYTFMEQDINVSPTNLVYVTTGTYKAQPIITFNFSAASSVTVVNVTNTTTGEQIQYSGSIAASDILIFNSELKTVTKNGTAVNFSGAFPSVEVGSNILTFTVTATSFTAKVSVRHLNAWL